MLLSARIASPPPFVQAGATTEFDPDSSKPSMPFNAGVRLHLLEAALRIAVRVRLPAFTRSRFVLLLPHGGKSANTAATLIAELSRLR